MSLLSIPISSDASGAKINDSIINSKNPLFYQPLFFWAWSYKMMKQLLARADIATRSEYIKTSHLLLKFDQCPDNVSRYTKVCCCASRE